jgi:hypothetical protein
MISDDISGGCALSLTFGTYMPIQTVIADTQNLMLLTLGLYLP